MIPRFAKEALECARTQHPQIVKRHEINLRGID